MARVDAEKQPLIDYTSPDAGTSQSNDGFNPIDHATGRSRSRRLIFGVVVACCVAIGLSLAVALPLANRSAGSPGGSQQQQQQQVRLLMSAGGDSKLESNDDMISQQWTTVRTTRKYHPIVWPWWRKTTPTNSSSITPATTSETVTSATHWPTRHHHHTWTWPWPWWRNQTKTTSSPNITMTTETVSSSTHRPTWHHPTWWPWWRNITTSRPPTTATAVTAVPAVTTAGGTAEASTSDGQILTTTADWLPSSCPRLSPRIGSRVILEDIVSTPIWYEIVRIQTFNSPAYVERVSCSTMQLSSSVPTDAEAYLAWEEGRLSRRERKSVTLYLHRQDTSSQHWQETTSRSNSTNIDQFSFLARIDGFLMVYECFPRVNWPPNPGYVIRVYSNEPRPTYYGSRLAEALLSLADEWGLNPTDSSPEKIRQRYCDSDIGHA